MKHSAMLKFAVMMSAVLALYLGGCVEVNNPNITPIDFQSSVRFVNLANTGSSMVVNVDKSASATATVAFQAASSYYSLPSGSRFFSFTYGATNDTLRQPLTPDYKYTFFSVFEPTNTDVARTYTLVAERNTYTGTTIFPAGSQLVQFFNMSSDTAATVSGGLKFHLMTATWDTSNASLVKFAGASPYWSAATSKSPQFMVVGSKGDTLIPATAVGAGDGRYGIVFSGSKKASSWSAKVFKED
jgi:hypothetical protein